MKYLLDTNLISEPMKARPNAGVVNWLSAQDEEEVFISVVTIAELRYGIERLATGKRRGILEQWVQRDLRGRFAGRILPVDTEVADVCGRLVARSEGLGHPIEARDAFIAATAEVHGLTLVTRNASDFQPTVKSILTPWT